MTKFVNAASSGSLEIENPEGSFWKGNAKALNYINNKKTLQRFENLSWSMLPFQLLKGSIAFRIIVTDHQLTADGIINAGLTGGRSISDLQASLPIDLVSNFIRDVKVLSPRGNLEIKAALLSIDPIQIKQPINVLWTNAGLSISPISTLGDYSIDLMPKKDSIEFNLQTIKGSLNVKGQGSYSDKLGGRFNGQARANDEAKLKLASLLHLMGPVEENGNVNIFFTFPPIK